VGRVREKLEIGNLVVHRIYKDVGFEIGIVIGLDWPNGCAHVWWCGGRRVYHSLDMLKWIA